MNKKIIWALFDDGYGSWNKSINSNDEYDIYSIGIIENEWINYHNIDLSIANSNIIKELSKLPKPNIIVASPPCESWSHADVVYRCFRKCDENAIYMHNEHFYLENCDKVKRNYLSQQMRRLIGECTALGLVKIIDYFQPEIWVIENPTSSKLWNYLENFGTIDIKNGITNKCYYNCYDVSFSKKNTTFLSNMKLNLKKLHVIPGAEFQVRTKNDSFKWGKIGGGKSYNEKSKIPEKLIQDLKKEFKNGI